MSACCDLNGYRRQVHDLCCPSRVVQCDAIGIGVSTRAGIAHRRRYVDAMLLQVMASSLRRSFPSPTKLLSFTNRSAWKRGNGSIISSVFLCAAVWCCYLCVCVCLALWCVCVVRVCLVDAERCRGHRLICGFPFPVLSF